MNINLQYFLFIYSFSRKTSLFFQTPESNFNKSTYLSIKITLTKIMSFSARNTLLKRISVTVENI